MRGLDGQVAGRWGGAVRVRPGFDGDIDCGCAGPAIYSSPRDTTTLPSQSTTALSFA